MNTIRRQSILSFGIVYFGFALGFLNIYLFTREGGFTETQYGLTGTFIAIANVMFSFASLGMQAYIYKFYPYYKDNLPPDKNDMISLSLLTSTVGFILVMGGGLIFKNLVIRKFGAHSADLVKYYYWIFPFGFGLTMYSLLEAYAWQLKKSVLTNYLREVQWRLFISVFILLSFFGIIKSFDIFIKLYAFTYILLALILFLYLIITHKIYLMLTISRVTKKFFKKIITLAAFVWSGGLIYNIASVFDTIVIAAVMPDGLAFAGIFTLAQNIASIIQAPQRGIIAASVSSLSQAWKDKDYEKINRIYHRSSINQLIFAVGIFVLLWINFTDSVLTFHLKPAYLEAKYVFLFLGLWRIVDMGTGVNSQIISTSTFWRFEFFTGIILLSLSLPSNYILTKQLGVVGPAIATFASMLVYNAIRYFFLLRRFNMQPFTEKSLYTLLLALVAYLVCHFLFSQYTGFIWLFIRSLVFTLIYLTGVIYLKLSPDFLPVLGTIRKRLKL
ncbi:MAG TPA: polysaccharide biosynthesis C-terminal domain-containing protein [Puia sp.]|nr:polysaccharide biosynthesis C-terminal domain-containing protein [Puia sp.]